MPACGFAMGLERLLLAMEESGIPFPEAPKCNLSIVTAGENAVLKAFLAVDGEITDYAIEKAKNIADYIEGYIPPEIQPSVYKKV